jgi:RimJ/RimL family protein N-acetyltransferase
MAFIVGDQWQNLGLGTKMVDYTLDIAVEMGVETVYAIMLPDNYRALNLTKKMGFDIEYLSDGTVKGTLNLNRDIQEMVCEARIHSQPQEETTELEKKETRKESTIKKQEKNLSREATLTPA